MVDRQHDHCKRTLQRSVLVQIGNDDFRVSVALELDDDTCVLVRLITYIADVREDLFVYQLCDSLHERGTIYAVRNFCDDDLLTAAFELFHAGLSAHFHTAPPRLEILADAVDAADDAAGRKIRALHVFHQLVQCDVRVVDLCADSIDNFGEIMGRNIGSHADGNSSAAVHEQIWKCGGENGRLSARLVVIRDEIDGVFLHVGHERGAEM